MTKQGVGNPMVAVKVATETFKRIPAIASGLRAGLGIVGTIALVYFGSKALKRFRQNRIMQKAGDDPDIRAAMDIYMAIPDGLKKSQGSLFSPTGFISDAINQIARLWTSTNTERILEVSKRITNLDRVFKSFYIIYEEDLYSLLSKALTPSELDVFMNLTKTGSFSRTKKAETNLLVYTIKPVTIRKTPKKIDSASWERLTNSNIITNVPAGKIIGWTTGIEIPDEAKTVVFTEVKAYADFETKPEHIVYAWKGALKFYTKSGYDTEFGNLITALKKYLFRFKSSDLSGINMKTKSIKKEVSLNKTSDKKGFTLTKYIS